MECSKDICALGRKKTAGSCYNLSELVQIADVIQKKDPRALFNRRQDAKKLWNDLEAYMRVIMRCTDELCWVEKLGMSKIEDTAFKPEMPKEWLTCNKDYAPNNNCMNTWLSNIDINKVLKQYEDNIPNFMYLGAVPIDFAKIRSSKIDTFSIQNCIKNGKKYVGIVFNTDPSYKPGQHWICAFIDIPKREINFFDSYGKDGVYPKEVQEFFDKIVAEGKKLRMKFHVKKNTTRHQLQNSECGVYCMYFISRRLKMKFEDIVSDRLPDSEVNKERWRTFYRSDSCRHES
jgi:hypothetical protein